MDRTNSPLAKLIVWQSKHIENRFEVGCYQKRWHCNLFNRYDDDHPENPNTPKQRVGIGDSLEKAINNALHKWKMKEWD